MGEGNHNVNYDTTGDDTIMSHPSVNENSKTNSLHKKWSFPLRVSSVRPDPQETADLVTCTEENLNGKLHFLWSEMLLLNK